MRSRAVTPREADVRALLQRVTEARVRVAGREVASIGPGLLILLGVGHDDTDATAIAQARRTTELRLFKDEAGKTNGSLLFIEVWALVVSLFTLFAHTSRGRRPGYTGGAAPDVAERLYQRFARALAEAGVADVQTGTFGAEMLVELVNDGPFTIWLDTDR
jgi:D-tyrosyl-tRNA(Tyr) deacylase